jgi:hypothetical protein
VEHKNVRKGMKVIPHSKTADGRSQGLTSSAVYARMIKSGQPYLYVVKIRGQEKNDGDYKEVCLSNIENDPEGGDWFLASDFEVWNPGSHPVDKKSGVFSIMSKDHALMPSSVKFKAYAVYSVEDARVVFGTFYDLDFVIALDSGTGTFGQCSSLHECEEFYNKTT